VNLLDALFSCMTMGDSVVSAGLFLVGTCRQCLLAFLCVSPPRSGRRAVHETNGCNEGVQQAGVVPLLRHAAQLIVESVRIRGNSWARTSRANNLDQFKKVRSLEFGSQNVYLAGEGSGFWFLFQYNMPAGAGVEENQGVGQAFGPKHK
jgi:hypothetical protein